MQILDMLGLKFIHLQIWERGRGSYSMNHQIFRPQWTI